MAVLNEKRAILVSRLGAARLGAIRLGFLPVDTAQDTTGAVGFFYMWREHALPATVWVTERE